MTDIESALSFNIPGRIAYRGLLALLTLSLLAGSLAAQTDQATKRAEAVRLYGEGAQLYKEGSKDCIMLNLAGYFTTYA